MLAGYNFARARHRWQAANQSGGGARHATASCVIIRTGHYDSHNNREVVADRALERVDIRGQLPRVQNPRIPCDLACIPRVLD